MDQKINIKVYGKCILAGEYIVLKSYEALVFPLVSQFIELKYQKNTQDLTIINQSDCHKKAISKKDFFEVVLNQALKMIFKNKKDIKGVITLNFKMHFGAGVGASAVICVLIGRLFQHLKWLKTQELFTFCHTLENKLHGQSSGIDIAAVLTGKPILYQFKKQTPSIKIFIPQWQPLIFLSYCGKGESTKINIQNIKMFWQTHPNQSEQLDQKMAQAVLEIKTGLSTLKEHKLNSLVKSFTLAEQCFTQWNLINHNLKQHILFLKKQGALAVKPTGSGSGGCVLSIWDKPPPVCLNKQLVLIF